MERSSEDRKKEARRLIRLPLSRRPDNVVYTPAKRLQFARYAVELDELIVHFQHDGRRLYYLGEYPK
jgi:hypothetical protein